MLLALHCTLSALTFKIFMHSCHCSVYQTVNIKYKSSGNMKELPILWRMWKHDLLRVSSSCLKCSASVSLNQWKLLRDKAVSLSCLSSCPRLALFSCVSTLLLTFEIHSFTLLPCLHIQMVGIKWCSVHFWQTERSVTTSGNSWLHLAVVESWCAAG